MDLTTWLTGDIEYFGNGEYDLSALDYDAVFGLIGLIGEVKVSQFYRRGDKHVVCVHRNDDPELLDDDLSLVEGEDWSTTYSFDTGITASAAARIDGARKWQAGMCKVLVYLQSSYEFCRTRLGLLIVGLLFSRIVLSSENHFIVECSQAYLDETELHTIPAVEFLQMSQQSWTHMPWNLCDESDSDVPRWAADSMKRYLDLHRTALKLLATHSTLHNGNPFQPLGPLPSCVELALERLVGGVDVSQSAADAVAPSETIQTQSASRNQQKRTKASDSLVSASRRHEDNETVDDTKRRRLDVEKSAPRQQQGEGQVKQSSEHNTGAYDDSDSRALHLTDRVGQWRDTVAVHCSPSPSEACGGTPVDSVDSGGVDTSAHAQDAEFNGALEAADMQRSKLRAELESAGVDQPVPYASVDEQVYDMLTVIAARRMVVHLVSSEEMDAVISAIREGLSAKTGP